MRSRIASVIGTAVVIASLALTGCGTGGGGGGAAAADDIVLWNPFVGADGDNWQAMIAAYNDSDPQLESGTPCRVHNVSMEQEAMYTNIATAYPTGTGIPDLMIVHAERIAAFEKNGMLKQLDPLLAQFPDINGNNYVEAAWDMGEIDGHRYSVPMDIHSWVTYVNLDLLEKYGPHVLDDGVVTFDEIRQVGEAAKADGIAALGLTWFSVNFLTTYGQLGGALTEDGVNPTIDTPAGREALGLWHDLYNEGVTTQNGDDPSQMFQTGQVVFLPEGIWYQNTAREIEGFDWAVTHTPQIDADNIVNWSSSHQWVLFNSAERSAEKEECIGNFLNWVRDNSIDWARAGQNPAALAILDNDEYRQMPQAFLLEGDNPDTLRIFKYLYNGFATANIERVAGDAVFGNRTVEEALDDAQRSTQDQVNQDQAGLPVTEHAEDGAADPDDAPIEENQE